MRTTLDLDQGLLREAKRRAIDQGATLTGLLERALRQYLGGTNPRPTRYRFRPIMLVGSPIRGINIADREEIYERMEGRR